MAAKRLNDFNLVHRQGPLESKLTICPGSGDPALVNVEVIVSSGLMSQWSERWIRDREVASLTPGQCLTK